MLSQYGNARGGELVSLSKYDNFNKSGNFNESENLCSETGFRENRVNLELGWASSSTIQRTNCHLCGLECSLIYWDEYKWDGQ